ncbi:hypothetical protein DUNSADRAFT_17266 [Dunaliella salina]|uniref:Uncharacterized protein n=1 Tax=Dunaliella salina TaxID=3046 RepID=A0ABQ7H0A5_DUNSA|nr:hypothetical protein DUNSADRAFT_17266 [Dunaliella salina]|eukprot:KAF5840297.1 hypothetical protein DUNSADRAFT_17266 [Dunaliella salina]
MLISYILVLVHFTSCSSSTGAEPLTTSLQYCSQASCFLLHEQCRSPLSPSLTSYILAFVLLSSPSQAVVRLADPLAILSKPDTATHASSSHTSGPNWIVPSSLALFLRSTPWLPATSLAGSSSKHTNSRNNTGRDELQGGSRNVTFGRPQQQQQQQQQPQQQHCSDHGSSICPLLLPSQLWLPNPATVEVLGEDVPYLHVPTLRPQVRVGPGVSVLCATLEATDLGVRTSLSVHAVLHTLTHAWQLDAQATPAQVCSPGGRLESASPLQAATGSKLQEQQQQQQQRQRLEEEEELQRDVQPSRKRKQRRIELQQQQQQQADACEQKQQRGHLRCSSSRSVPLRPHRLHAVYSYLSRCAHANAEEADEIRSAFLAHPLVWVPQPGSAQGLEPPTQSGTGARGEGGCSGVSRGPFLAKGMMFDTLTF